MLADYYKIMLDRLNRMDPERAQINVVAMNTLQGNAQQQMNQDSFEQLLKPIKRPKGSQEFSLFNIDGVPSIKVGKGPLGSGHWARTYLHVDGREDRNRPYYYAVKVFRFKENTKADPLPEPVRREIEALKREGRYLRHGYRVNQKNELKFYIVQTYIPGKTLYEALKECTRFSMEQTLSLMMGLSQSVQDFYKRNYAHGDLRLYNIKVTKSLLEGPSFTLLDFNDSVKEGEQIYFNKPILQSEFPHVATECCEVNYVQYTPASDMYALGLIFQQILDKTDYHPEIVGSCDALIEQMRNRNPQIRIELSDLISSLGKLRKVVQQPSSPQRQPKRIEEQVKQEVLAALNEYVGGFRSLRGLGRNLMPYFNSCPDDRSYTEKANLITTLITSLNGCTTSDEYVKHLKTALISYISTYVVKDLNHYLNRSDLGAGMGSLIRALKALKQDFDAKTLISEVAHALPRYKSQDWAMYVDQRKDYISKFTSELSKPSDLNASYEWTLRL